MTNILGLSGSLRKASFNTGLLNAATGLMPEGATLDARTLHGVPLYDGDLEASQGVPPAVAALKEALSACDGLLLVTPEYNNAIPGVFKNAIDWMSRPPARTGLFKAKPVAVNEESETCRLRPFGTVKAVPPVWFAEDPPIARWPLSPLEFGLYMRLLALTLWPPFLAFALKRAFRE